MEMDSIEMLVVDSPSDPESTAALDKRNLLGQEVPVIAVEPVPLGQRHSD